MKKMRGKQQCKEKAKRRKLEKESQKIRVDNRRRQRTRHGMALTASRFKANSYLFSH